jgi:XapX domain-containing protein
VLQSVIGFAVGLAVGAVCRWFDIPSPAPPRIIGAVILIAMTLGFIAGGRFVASP